MKQRELSPVLCDELDVCDGGWLREGGKVIYFWKKILETLFILKSFD